MKLSNAEFLEKYYSDRKDVQEFLKKRRCPKCGSVNTNPSRKYCSHGRHCNACGYYWCTYYSSMSRKERLLRKKFFLEHGGIEEKGKRYLWSGIVEE